jgi:hypothetical protein
MNDSRVRRMQGERGASLILAIVFMVVVGAISAAVLSATASGLQDRVALDTARDREYAADGAIEIAVTRVRNNGGTCAGGDPDVTINSVAIHVNCIASPAVVVGPTGELLSQNDIVFTACKTSDVVSGACPTATAIINAQVNFQGTSAPLKTFVQSWSVNR